MSNLGVLFGIGTYIIILLWLLIRHYFIEKNHCNKQLQDIIRYVSTVKNFPVILIVANCVVTLIYLILHLYSNPLGLIVHIYQQLLLFAWFTTYMKRALFALDPFSRYTHPKKLKKFTSTCIVLVAMLSTLITISYIADFKGNAVITTSLIGVVGVLIILMSVVFGRMLIKLLMQSQRSLKMIQGHSNSYLEKDPASISQVLLRFIHDRVVGGQIVLGDLSPFHSSGCIKGIKLQNIIVERLLVCCVFGLITSIVKVIWNIFSNNRCGLVSHCDDHTGLNADLDLWLPDTLFILFWYVTLYDLFGMNQSIKLSSNKERADHSHMSDEQSISEGESGREVTLSNRRTAMFSFATQQSESFSFNNDANTILALSLPLHITSNPLIRSSSSSKRNVRRSNPVLRALGLSGINSNPETSRAMETIDKCKIVRELVICCTEMILVDPVLYFPVPALFTGLATFIVLYMRNDQTSNESEMWIEFSRSDYCSNVSSPSFSVTFIVPEVIVSKSGELDLATMEWKIEVYNVYNWKNVFSVNDALLQDQILIGELLFGTNDFMTSSAADEENLRSTMNVQSKIEKPIQLINLLSSKYIRLGGLISISSTLMSPFTDVVSNFNHGINSTWKCNRDEDYSHETNILSDSNTSTANLQLEVEDVHRTIAKKEQIPRLSLAKMKSLKSINVDEKTEIESLPEVVATKSKIVAVPSTSSSKLSQRCIVRGFSFMKNNVERGDNSNASPAPPIRVHEELCESPFTYDVPCAYLKMLVKERTTELMALHHRFLGEVNQQTMQSFIDDSDCKWTVDLVRAVRSQIEEMKTRIEEFEMKTHSFKSSASKSDITVQFAPINLHVQILAVNNSNYVENSENSFLPNCALYDFVTVGAFAAHCHKFRGGGMWHIMSKLERAIRDLANNNNALPHQGNFILPHEAWNSTSLNDFPLNKKLFELAFLGRERLDACLPQCLAAVATGFVSRIQLMTPEALERASTIGMLFQFESLLSTQGSELGMLSDMYATVKVIERLHITSHEEIVIESNSGKSASNQRPTISIYWKYMDEDDEASTLVMDLGFTSHFYNSLPEIIHGGKTFPVVPVLFSVGVNELQSYAETMQGRKAYLLQDIINTENLSRIERYCSLVLQLATGNFDQVDSTTNVDIASEVSHDSVMEHLDDNFDEKIPSISSIMEEHHESDNINVSGVDLILMRRKAIRKTQQGKELLGGGALNNRISRLHSIAVAHRPSLVSVNDSELQPFESNTSSMSNSSKAPIDSTYILNNSIRDTVSTPTKPTLDRNSSLKKLWQNIDEVEKQQSQNIASDSEQEVDAFRASFQRSSSIPYSGNKFLSNSENDENKYDDDDDDDDDDDGDEDVDKLDYAMSIARAIDSKVNTGTSSSRLLSVNIRNRLKSIAQFVRSNVEAKSATEEINTQTSPLSNSEAHRHSIATIYSDEFVTVKSAYDLEANMKDVARSESIFVDKNRQGSQISSNFRQNSISRKSSVKSSLNIFGDDNQVIDETDELGEDDEMDEDMDGLGVLSSKSFGDDSVLKTFNDLVLPSEEKKRIVVKELQTKLTALVTDLRNHVIASAGTGGKPYQILVAAAKLTRALDGVRSTSCKSAKDRTGMSVTLEEAQIVRDTMGLSDIDTKHILDTLRMHGVRIENAKKNVGKARFAFNNFQRRFLPEDYTPPLATTGSVQS